MTAFVEHFVKVDSSWQSKLPKGTPNDAPLGDDCVFTFCVHSTAIAYSAKEAQLVIFGLPSAICLSASVILPSQSYSHLAEYSVK